MFGRITLISVVGQLAPRLCDASVSVCTSIERKPAANPPPWMNTTTALPRKSAHSGSNWLPRNAAYGPARGTSPVRRLLKRNGSATFS